MARVARAGLATLALLAASFASCATGCASGPSSIGAVLGRDNETRALHVREVPSQDGAADTALAPGDEIVMIEGAYVKDLGADEIRAKLRGDAGSKVALTVVRGEHVKHVKIMRAPMGARKPALPRETRIAE